MHGFAARHGWRAYALPVLIVLTVVVVLQPTAGRRDAASAAPTAAGPATNPPSSAATAALGAKPKATTVRTIGESTACHGNKLQALALVSLHKQHVWLCEQQRQVYSTAVTTGAVALGLATPTGTWQVVGKESGRYLSGPGYREYVRYWVPFWGPYGFHDSSWQKMAYGSSGYRQHGSHGCVHMPMAAMKWFYKWARVGTTTVTVVT